MRAVLLDTETTGLDPADGHRVIEVAVIELQNDVPSGPFFHCLIDPHRPVPPDATAIHGFSNADLAGKPSFAEIMPELLRFLGDAPIIAHNAPFDFGFLDAELTRAGAKPLDRGRMIDSLALARQRFPGLPNNLDALCRRFGVDLSERTSHNALLDCRLLAAVYLELTGGRQRSFALSASSTTASPEHEPVSPHTRIHIAPNPEELARHREFVRRLKDPLWLRQ